MNADEWKQRILKAWKKGNGEFPDEYPYRHWKSWLKTGKASLEMIEGWLLAGIEYKKEEP